MPAPSVVGTGAVTSFNGVSSVNVPLHASTQAGDLVVVAVTNGNPMVPSFPSGWTGSSTSSPFLLSAIGYKVVDAADVAAGTVLVSFSTTEGPANAVALTITGIDQNAAVNAISAWFADTNTATTSTLNTITTTVANTLQVGICLAIGATTYTPPGTMAEVLDTGGAENIAIFTETIASAGVVASKNVTADTAASHRRAITLAVAPVPATAPAVTTEAASDVTSTTATLNGTVTSNGAATTPTFRYGTASDLTGASTATADEGVQASGASGAAVSLALTGLLPETTYYFRLEGTNSEGSATPGDILSFITEAADPRGSVTTSSTEVGSATLSSVEVGSVTLTSRIVGTAEVTSA